MNQLNQQGAARRAVGAQVVVDGWGLPLPPGFFESLDLFLTVGPVRAGQQLGVIGILEPRPSHASGTSAPGSTRRGNKAARARARRGSIDLGLTRRTQLQEGTATLANFTIDRHVSSACNRSSCLRTR